MTQNTSDCGDECEQALAELEAYLDGELSDDSVRDIRTHLRACLPCTERASFEEQLRILVRKGCVDDAPPDLLERVRRRLLVGNVPEE